jgi:hypothetical protein
MRRIAIGILVLGLAGCEGQVVKESSSEAEIRLQKFAVDNFPKNVKNVQEYGNGWYTFEMEIEGKNRKMLFHGYRLGYDGQRESLTELAP